MALTVEVRSCAEKLARFFPSLPARSIPVRVQSLRPGQGRVQEATVVEYGGPEIAIFTSKLPVEFNDQIRISREGEARGRQAAVVALQYHEGSKAVAVRFLEGPCEWMIQP